MSNDGYLHRYLGHVASSLEVYSFGTTGRIKGLELTHQNFIAITTSVNHSRFVMDKNDDNLIYQISFLLGETPVLMERFDFRDMLKAVERFKVTYMSVLPSLMVVLAKSEVVMRW
nr:4-coumarate--CoA ligase-like 9 [Tanacetum cinerariifolium]